MSGAAETEDAAWLLRLSAEVARWACDAVGRTLRDGGGITYSVVATPTFMGAMAEVEIWHRRVVFDAADPRHRAGGLAFIEAATRQARIASSVEMAIAEAGGRRTAPSVAGLIQKWLVARTYLDCGDEARALYAEIRGQATPEQVVAMFEQAYPSVTTRDTHPEGEK